MKELMASPYFGGTEYQGILGSEQTKTMLKTPVCNPLIAAIVLDRRCITCV